MQDIKKLMSQICNPHIMYHYKILSHQITLVIALVLLLFILMLGWSMLDDIGSKHFGLKICFVSVGTLIVIVTVVLNFWNYKTKTWYDATVNSSSTFVQAKKAVSKEYPFCIVIEEREESNNGTAVNSDIDKPIYFLFCKDEATVKHINNQINQFEENGNSVVFLNSNSKMIVIHTTKFKKIKTAYESPVFWSKNQENAYLPQSYSIINQPIIFQNLGVDLNNISTNQLNGNLIQLFKDSN